VSIGVHSWLRNVRRIRIRIGDRGIRNAESHGRGCGERGMRVALTGRLCRPDQPQRLRMERPVSWLPVVRPWLRLVGTTQTRSDWSRCGDDVGFRAAVPVFRAVETTVQMKLEAAWRMCQSLGCAAESQRIGCRPTGLGICS